MLRATSEMAVAINVKSDPLNPKVIASARPFWRAVTISAAELIPTRVSLSMFNGPLGHAIEVRQPFLKIQGRPYAFQRQAQLHHGKCHVGLDSHDHGFRSP